MSKRQRAVRGLSTTSLSVTVCRPKKVCGIRLHVHHILVLPKNSSPYSIINIVENGAVRNGLVSKKKNVGACKKGKSRQMELTYNSQVVL